MGPEAKPEGGEMVRKMDGQKTGSGWVARLTPIVRGVKWCGKWVGWAGILPPPPLATASRHLASFHPYIYMGYCKEKFVTCFQCVE